MVPSAKRRILERCGSIFNKYWNWSGETNIIISLTAISSSCDFSVCTFVFFKSMQWNACAFCAFKKYLKYLKYLEVVTSLPASEPLMVE